MIKLLVIVINDYSNYNLFVNMTYILYFHIYKKMCMYIEEINTFM